MIIGPRREKTGFAIDDNENAKTCLPCDKFGYRSSMMFLDENEVIPFQKYPLNDILLIIQRFYRVPEKKIVIF